MFCEDDNETLVSKNAGNFANTQFCVGLNRGYLYDACCVLKFDLQTGTDLLENYICGYLRFLRFLSKIGSSLEKS